MRDVYVFPFIAWRMRKRCSQFPCSSWYFPSASLTLELISDGKARRRGVIWKLFEEQDYGYQTNETMSEPVFCMPSNILVWHWGVDTGCLYFTANACSKHWRLCKVMYKKKKYISPCLVLGLMNQGNVIIKLLYFADWRTALVFCSVGARCLGFLTQLKKQMLWVARACEYSS